MSDFATTDLSDAAGGKLRHSASGGLRHSASGGLRHVAPTFHDFGGIIRFSGQIKTLATFEDNSKVREAVETQGHGQVLVVDGGASMQCALFGGNLATLAADNGWAGLVINGCVRDCAELKAAKIGIKALAAHPKKSEKRGLGTYDVRLFFGGVVIHAGDWLYADEDGIIISATPLSN